MSSVEASEIQAFDASYVLPTYRRQPGVFVRGKGMRLWDSAGKEYLDFLGGIAVDQLGHCHPAMVEAITKQANTLIHTSNHLLTPPQPLLAERLHHLTWMDKAFLANDGTTAMECAIKIAKKHGLNKAGSAAEFISLHRSFHGRSLGALSATAQDKYQAPFRPLIPGFRHLHANDVDALRGAVSERTAAVILEPIQGEGGLTVLTEEYLREARRLTTEHDALLIIDEVQTGMGRTGWWLAIQKYGIEADIVTLAKGLGSGIPIGACLTKGFANCVLQAGEHGSTFGGNAFACAVSLAVLETIEREGLLENARIQGAYLAEGLSGLNGVVEVRGEGLMRGAVLDRPVAREIVRLSLENRLIINATDDNTLRLVPPLIVKREEIDEAIGIMGEACRAV